MEIIEEIDKRVITQSLSSQNSICVISNCYYLIVFLNLLQFIAMIQSKRPELESKISGMRILDHNPKKPVVRMANLCVVSAHTVNHSY